MASRSLGTLTVDLIAKFGGFTQGMTQAEREADKKTREMQKKMTQRARAIDDAFSGMANTIKTSMLGLGVSAAAGVAGMVSMARDTARLSDEVQRFSTLSNTTTSDFQRLAFGANTVGVSTEKLADIFKDVQDKAGDFAQTGGGGMADFFENIAPRVGVTIEQFRRLSGPEALQLYVSSLEKANLSQQDMTFYMEAIASDSALLLPLLRNNGSAWRELGDDAQRYGAVLSDDVIAASKAYKDETAKLEAAMQGVRNEVGGELLPVLSEFNAFMRDPATLQAIREMTGLLGGWAKAAAEAAQVVNNSSFWGWLQVGKDDAQDVDAAIVETEKKIKSLQSTVASMSRPLHKFWNADDIVIAEGQIGTLQSKLESLYTMRDKRNASVVDQLDALGRVGLDSYPSTNPNAPFSPVTPPKGSRGKSQAEKDQEAAQRFLQSLRDQVAQVKEMGTLEKLIHDMREGSLRFVTKEQQAEAERLAMLVDFQKDGAKLLEEQNRLREEGKRLTEETLQPLEALAKESARINELLAGGYIDPEVARRALKQAQEASLGSGGNVNAWILGAVQPLSGGEFDAQADRYTAEAKAEDERYAAQLERLSQAMEAERLKYEEYFGIFESMQKTHADRMSQIDQARYSVMLGTAEQGFGALAESMKGAQGEASGAYKALFAVSKAFGIAQAMLGMTNAISNAMVLPFPANLAAAASAAGYMATVISNVQGITMGFAEGGYTGTGGKYEVAGLVHRGEGVLNQDDMRALGGPAAFEQFRKGLHGYANGGLVGRPSAPALLPGYHASNTKAQPAAVVQVIEDSSKAGRTETSQGASGEDVIRIFVSNIRQGGDAAQALENTYSLARQGR